MPKLIATPRGPMTRREASVVFNIPFGTICRRIWQGYPMEKLFAPPLRWADKPERVRPEPKRNPPKYGYFVTPWGRLALHKVAKQIGIKSETLTYRLYKMAWPQEEAFNTPGFGKRGVHFIIPPEEYKRRIEEVRANASRL